MIELKTEKEIERIRESARLVVTVLEKIKGAVIEGIDTKKLDTIAHKEIISLGAKPAFLGYKGYPSTICASVNNEVVHGIPSDKKLKEGDIISIDLGLFYNGFYSDVAYTIPVGEIKERAIKILNVTREALNVGISNARAGNFLGDISSAIQNYVEGNSYSVVRDYVGHGIGRTLHEEPQIPNYGVAGTGPKLCSGMVLAIEPMVNEGTWEVEIKDDNWTAVTKDGLLSCHFEHMVVITENGPEILTKRYL